MFEDFIYIKDNFLTLKECSRFIDLFEKAKKQGLVKNRQTLEECARHLKADETLVLSKENLSKIVPDEYKKLKDTLISKILAEVYNYQCHYSILQDIRSQKVSTARLQKTSLGEGYHIWHFEALDKCVNRVLVFSVSLNNVNNGGETEFLYQHKRYEQKAGQLLIWPAHFTHTHRGNPPLSNEKYIITGWIDQDEH